MAQLTFNNTYKYRHMGMEDDDDIQVPAVETLRDRILKQCLQKQLCTALTLSDQLGSKKDFVSATEERSVTTCVSGLSTHQHFQNVKQQLELKESLKASGLTGAEIELLLENEISSEKNRSGLEAPHVRIQRLKTIEEKLALRQKSIETEDLFPQTFSGAVTLSRKEYEEECRLLPLSKDAHQLTDCLVRLEPKCDDSIPADHPINFVKQMNEELTKKIFIKKRKDDQELKRTNECIKAHEVYKKKCSEVRKTKIAYLTEHPGTFWDMEAIPRIINNEHVPKVYSCKNKNKPLVIAKKEENNFKTDFTKPFVFALEKDKLIPIDIVKKQNMNMEEIVKIEKFKNYSPGEPSETLFIKNLPRKISPTELVAVFGNFESNDQNFIERSTDDFENEKQLSLIASSEIHTPENQKQLKLKENLKASGLTSAEINLLLENEKSSEISKCTTESGLRIQRLKEIEEKLFSAKPSAQDSSKIGSICTGNATTMAYSQFSSQHRLLYRILGGRMAGQAFVTFPNKTIASQALAICNGFNIQDRPMVIEFGKKK